MFQLFTTREISTAIWIIVFIMICLMSKRIRNSAKDALKTALSKQLLIPLLPVLIYSIILTFLFSNTNIWKMYYSKDIILWILFVGIPLYYGIVQKKSLDNYFKETIIENLKFIAIVEFFLGIFSFKLITELILVPFITILALLDTVAGMKSEHKLLKKYTSIVLAITGIFIFYRSFEVALNNYNTLNIMDTLVSFFIPFVFTILFIPISYLLALYAKYQIIFIRMEFKEKKDRRTKKWHRWLVLRACNVSHKKLLYFEQNCIKNMYVGMDNNEYKSLINSFIQNTNDISIKINFQIVSIILLIVMSIVVFFNEMVALICALFMVISYIINMFQESKKSIRKCFFFLLSTSISSFFILALLIYIVPSLFTKIDSMNDLGMLIYILLYTSIQLIFFIIVTVRADHNVARISILIIATIATLIYTVGSAIVNTLPLSSLNSQLILLLHMTNEDISYFNKNYDGRTLINVFIQIITYPIWCNTMIATVIGELKAYKRNNV